jgi:hypothetical protein
MAQVHPPPAQSPFPVQDHTGGQDFTPPSDATTPIPVLVQPAPAFLYTRPKKQPPAVPAGYAPEWNISAGYSVTSLGTPSSGRAVLSGMDVSISRDSRSRFGVKSDFSFVRAPNAFRSGYPMSVLNYLIGPVFYPSSGNLLSTHLHLLVGAARVSGPFLNANGGLSIGYVNYPALAFGGGAEYRLSPAFGFRVGIDYLRTHFVNSSRDVRGQNDVRIVNSLVYYLGHPIRGRR